MYHGVSIHQARSVCLFEVAIKRNLISTAAQVELIPNDTQIFTSSLRYQNQLVCCYISAETLWYQRKILNVISLFYCLFILGKVLLYLGIICLLSETWCTNFIFFMNLFEAPGVLMKVREVPGVLKNVPEAPGLPTYPPEDSELFRYPRDQLGLSLNKRE